MEIMALKCGTLVADGRGGPDLLPKENKMTTYIVETWRAPSKDGSAGIKAQIQIRDYDPDKGQKWRYKAHTSWGFDYALGHSGNREQAVRFAVRKSLHNIDPITVTYSGETARGYLYIVELTD